MQAKCRLPTTLPSVSLCVCVFTVDVIGISKRMEIVSGKLFELNKESS